MMRWIFFFSCSFFLGMSPVTAQIRVGYVDLRKALNSVEDGIKAKSELTAEKTKYQKTLNSRQEQLKREKQVYESRATILRGEAKRKAQLNLQKKFFELQQEYTRFTRELAKSEAVATRKIFQKMEVIIQQIARENNLYLMLEKTESSVLYALPEMDYTSELIRRYNRLYHGKKTTKVSRKRSRRRPRKRSSND